MSSWILSHEKVHWLLSILHHRQYLMSKSNDSRKPQIITCFSFWHNIITFPSSRSFPYHQVGHWSFAVSSASRSGNFKEAHSTQLNTGFTPTARNIVFNAFIHGSISLWLSFVCFFERWTREAKKWTSTLVYHKFSGKWLQYTYFHNSYCYLHVT